VKARIIPTLINRKEHEELLWTVPNVLMLDLAVVYRIVEESEDGVSAAVITDDAMEAMNMTAEELVALAEDNFSRDYAPEIVTVTDTLKFITNSKKLFGASGIIFSDLLKAAGEDFGIDYYILPASVHEVMLIPEGAMEEGRMAAMLKEGNAKLASADEVLSENIYKYSIASGTLGIVNI